MGTSSLPRTFLGWSLSSWSVSRVVVPPMPSGDLEGPSREIIVEPLETPQPVEIPKEAPEPVPA
jgi:hypothetical protein